MERYYYEPEGGRRERWLVYDRKQVGGGRVAETYTEDVAQVLVEALRTRALLK